MSSCGREPAALRTVGALLPGPLAPGRSCAALFPHRTGVTMRARPLAVRRASVRVVPSRIPGLSRPNPVARSGLEREQRARVDGASRNTARSSGDSIFRVQDGFTAHHGDVGVAREATFAGAHALVRSEHPTRIVPDEPRELDDHLRAELIVRKRAASHREDVAVDPLVLALGVSLEREVLAVASFGRAGSGAHRSTIAAVRGASAASRPQIWDSQIYTPLLAGLAGAPAKHRAEPARGSASQPVQTRPAAGRGWRCASSAR